MEVDLAKANRQMVAERQALLAENARLKQTISQRSADTAGELVDGLDVLLGMVATDNSDAKLLIEKLARQLEQIRASATGILTLNGNP